LDYEEKGSIAWKQWFSAYLWLMFFLFQQAKGFKLGLKEGIETEAEPCSSLVRLLMKFLETLRGTGRY
jgi:hypothetical protein